MLNATVSIAATAFKQPYEIGMSPARFGLPAAPILYPMPVNLLRIPPAAGGKTGSIQRLRSPRILYERYDGAAHARGRLRREVVGSVLSGRIMPPPRTELPNREPRKTRETSGNNRLASEQVERMLDQINHCSSGTAISAAIQACYAETMQDVQSPMHVIPHTPDASHLHAGVDILPTEKPLEKSPGSTGRSSRHGHRPRLLRRILHQLTTVTSFISHGCALSPLSAVAVPTAATITMKNSGMALRSWLNKAPDQQRLNKHANAGNDAPATPETPAAMQRRN